MYIAGDEATEIFAQLEVPKDKKIKDPIDAFNMFDTCCNLCDQQI